MRKTVFFLHIPKAAGRTLHAVIENNYAAPQIYSIDGSDREASTRAFADLDETAQSLYRMVKGHMYYGVHRHIKNTYEYFTLLRHPVDRIASHYYYVLSQPRHYLHESVTSRRFNLEQYALSGISVELDNGQTRLIAGDERSPFGALTRSVLDQARQNLLRDFAVVGLAERFDDTLNLLKNRYGWNHLAYRRRRVNHDRPPLREIPLSTRKSIEDQNCFDMELYQFARDLFEKQILSERGVGEHD